MTGAGFSVDALSSSGRPIPLPRMLRDLLWEIAFPGEDVDDHSTLSEVFQVSVTRDSRGTERVLRESLTVSPDSLSEAYRIWFSMPWSIHYTLNLDDLDQAAEGRFDLRRRIRPISGLSWDLPPTPELLSVHLNGLLDDFPDVVFSDQQYGKRAAGSDPWYAHLVTELASHSIVFVGTTLDEPPLWSHIELRGRKTGQRELRPRSYLVTPSLSRARAAILESYNVIWIEMTHDQFALEILHDLLPAVEDGFSIVTRTRGTAGSHLIERVGGLRGQTHEDPRSFLLGREPDWSDVESGFAIEREYDVSLRDTAESQEGGILLVTGTAGSGKSSSLLRVALAMETDGRDVGVLNLDTDLGFARIRELVREANLDVLVIDDADEFNTMTGPLLRNISTDNPQMLLIAAMRSTRFEHLGVLGHLAGIAVSELPVPHLEDSDIDLLIDALDRANRLGVLRGRPLNEQRAVFQRQANRQLLVAMMEATSDERFEDKVRKECTELPQELAEVYATIALATSFRQYLTSSEVLLSIGDSSNEALNRIQRLINAKLVVKTAGDQLRVRHRVIADRVIDHYRVEGSLGEVLRGLMFAMATCVGPSISRLSRPWRILKRLLSHELMIRLSAGNLEVPRAAYDEVENLLTNEPHYWLQRGRFETEAGDPVRAQNFCDQARGLAPDDPLVKTGWAAITLRRAADHPGAPGAADRVAQALDELESAIAERGKRDAYPYHVIGSQGLRWARRAPMGRDVKVAFYEFLRSCLKEGRAFHAESRELSQLSEDIEHDYLMLAVPPDTNSPGGQLN